ncbi:M23 family metallopeptidase [Vibrio navarrensis]|uniref:M23 family metallopeptidase n=1 Tax=Vibrio navarrensis TaxID=29495 RepID=UPI00051DEA2E|nr:M23 family metallopeptidase [Vibrio navarrensis]KGK21002.1 hypothetical protein EA25_07025 [Vibrio navarrensis]
MKILHILVFAIIISLTACRGGSEKNSETQVDKTVLKSGVFVDSNVSGLSYVSGNTSGITSNGEFFYEEDKDVVFGVGSLNFGSVKGNDLVTPNDFENALSIARLLQTLDDDANPDNGIDIPESVQNSEVLTGAGSLLNDLNSPESIGKITKLTSLTTAGVRDVVSPQRAKEHMTKYTSYATIDKNVTSGIVHKSAWDTSYGYNQGYDQALLQRYPTLPNFHAGIDISTPNGTPIYSLTSGIVSRVKESIGAVYIKPDNQEGTIIYMHLSEIDVSKDNVITQGMKIGKSGKKGTGAYHLHIEWIKDGTYNKDEAFPSVPKEISRFNQGTSTTITDVTYDLKDLAYVVDNEDLDSIDGTWISSASKIPNSDGNTFEKTLFIDGSRGSYSVKYTFDTSCGFLVSESSADISFVFDDNKLIATFTENMPSYRDECGGFWVQTESFSSGSKISFNVIKIPNGDIVLKDNSCAFYSNSVCVMEAQPYIIQ